MRGVRLDSQNLRGMDLPASTFMGDMVEADLTGADLRDANLAGVDLFGAKLNGRRFARGQFRGRQSRQRHPDRRPDRRRQVRGRDHAGRPADGANDIMSRKGGGDAQAAKTQRRTDADLAAGNGVLNRRIFLEGAFVAAARALPAEASVSDAGQPLAVPRWMKELGARSAPTASRRGSRPRWCAAFLGAANPATQGIGVARTPLQLLDGTITPNGLHFDRSHSGTPTSIPISTGC